MIFVTVGSQKFQFNRLLKKLDQLVADHVITEEVYAQIGASDYIPHNYSYQSFYDRNQFAEMVNRCSILISHGGTGTIIDAVKQGKKVIAVPRLARYGEHVDDHQIQVLELFAKMDLLCVCIDVEDLSDALHTVRIHQYAAYQSNPKMVLKSIDAFVRSV